MNVPVRLRRTPETVTTQDGYLSDNQVGSTPVNHSLFFVDQAKDNERSSPRYEFMWRTLGLYKRSQRLPGALARTKSRQFVARSPGSRITYMIQDFSSRPQILGPVVGVGPANPVFASGSNRTAEFILIDAYPGG